MPTVHGRLLAADVAELAGVSGTTIGQWARRGYIRSSQSDGEPRGYSVEGVGEAAGGAPLPGPRGRPADVRRTLARPRPQHGPRAPGAARPAGPRRAPRRRAPHRRAPRHPVRPLAAERGAPGGHGGGAAPPHRAARGRARVGAGRARLAAARGAPGTGGGSPPPATRVTWHAVQQQRAVALPLALRQPRNWMQLARFALVGTS